MKLDFSLEAGHLQKKISELWELSASRIISIRDHYDESKGSPVFTVNGKYTTRGWTEWTQGFQFGSAILQYDADPQPEFLEYGRQNTLEKMSLHLTHMGVHDHGFNNISTYGNLYRLMAEGKIPFSEWENNYYQLAIKVSSSVQAARWTEIPGGGYIYSFNGPHSLFVDTLRTCRILASGYLLGQSLKIENDVNINLLNRLISHANATAKYSIFYGENRDAYDVSGRTAHECIFNTIDGNFRCVNTQQGYSGNTTWTRGLAWAILGFSELLEFLEVLKQDEFEGIGSKAEIEKMWLRAARATCDFYIQNTPTDGIPYWDTGAPGLLQMGDYLNRPSDPYNSHEPVDSSAAAIAAQGLLRLGKYLTGKDLKEEGSKYFSAGLNVARHLFDDPYISRDPGHQGLILHSIYHRPNAWDHIPDGFVIPCGESSMWGDYHARELAVYIGRIIKNEPYYRFFTANQ
jgi:unsaturated chondroitin disaccharide hydrolase